MSHLINESVDCVPECIAGLVSSNAGLIKLARHNVVLRSDLHRIEGKVALISGGGSGHEPAHVGYVGHGMLTGAVCGAVFASPPPNSIFAAIKAVNKYKPSGVVLIVKNYTGDRLCFGLAKDWARLEGIRVEMVIIADDCSRETEDQPAGKRGLAGVVLLHKMGGAMAENGDTFDAIVNRLRHLAGCMRTIGVCVKACSVPGQLSTSFQLAENEMELGLGIHGEAGIQRCPIQTSKQIAHRMISLVANAGNEKFLRPNDSVVVLVNNLGATSNLEMGVVSNDILRAMQEQKIKIQRIYTGTYLTSLQMAGVSLTVMKICPKLDYDIIPLLDMTTNALQTFNNVQGRGVLTREEELEDLDREVEPAKGATASCRQRQLMVACTRAACDRLMSLEAQLNDYDSVSGDADCGTTHCRGARAILSLPLDNHSALPSQFLQLLSRVCGDEMGGTSGAIYSIFLTALAESFSKAVRVDREGFVEALQHAVATVMSYTGAQRGHRTMIDVLQPICVALVEAQTNAQDILSDLPRMCSQLVLETVSMEAKAGRASYVNQKLLTNPDPGACAVGEIITACCNVACTLIDN